MADENRPKKIVKMSDILPPLKEKGPILPPSHIEKSMIEEIFEEEKVETEEIEPAQLEYPETEEKEALKELITAKRPKSKKRIFIILGVTGVVAIGLVCYFSLSKAEIQIKPKTETMQFKTELNIDKNVAFFDLEKNKIPGQLFQVEKEGQREFPATQEKEVQEKAKGIIIVYNQYSSAPQTLVKGTRFVSEKEKLFRTIETVVIPGAQIEEGQIIPSSIDIYVEAAEPGKDYNIGSSTFTIPGFKGTPKHAGFYGKSTQPMSGGAIGKVKVVSAEDIQGAKDILTVELKKKAKEELEKKIPADLNVIKDASIQEVVESSSSVEANQPAEKFTIKVKVAAKTLGFIKNEAVSLINDNLKGKISGNKTLIPDTMEINYSVTDINLEKGTAKLSCDVKERLVSRVDIEEIRRGLLGKSEVEVRQYLSSRLEIESAKLIFWPFWVKKIPSKESKIKITIEPAS